MKLKIVLLPLLIMMCLTVWGENVSNVDPETKFWKDSRTAIAYQPFTYVLKDGEFISTTPEVIKARLWLAYYWFFPEPGNNRFMDLLLEKESMYEELRCMYIDLEDELAIAKKRNFRFFIAGAGTGIIVISGILISIKVALK